MTLGEKNVAIRLLMNLVHYPKSFSRNFGKNHDIETVAAAIRAEAERHRAKGKPHA
jgi:hypothetical protein